MSEAELVGSMRQAASASGVSPFVVRRWISQGLLDEPPWTLDEVQKARDTQHPAPDLRRRTAAHNARREGNLSRAKALDMTRFEVYESYLDEEYTSNRAKRLVGRGA